MMGFGWDENGPENVESRPAEIGRFVEVWMTE